VREDIALTDIPTGTEQILLVDDEAPVLRSEQNMLESLGYKVIATRATEEALKLFYTKPNMFDLVITDETMPVMTGSELSQKLLKSGMISLSFCVQDLANQSMKTRPGLQEYGNWS